MKPSKLYEALHALISERCLCIFGAHAASVMPRKAEISISSF